MLDKLTTTTTSTTTTTTNKTSLYCYYYSWPGLASFVQGSLTKPRKLQQ